MAFQSIRAFYAFIMKTNVLKFAESRLDSVNY